MRILCLLGRFALHSVCGVCLFALVSLVALFFNWFGQWISAFGVNDFILVAIRGLEFFIFGLDLMLFVVFMLSEALQLGRAMATPEAIPAIGEDQTLG